METAFSEFTPIELNPNPSIEEIRQSYIDRNEKLDNDFIKNYLGLREDMYKPPTEPTKSSLPTTYDIQKLAVKTPNPTSKETSPKPNIPKVKNNITDEINAMEVSDEDKEFLIKMAKRESGFDPYITNQIGAYGLYQFLPGTIKTVGMTKSDFDDTKKQHIAALRLAEMNEKVNKDLFAKYVGTRKNGVLITRNGLRAAHALLGAGGVREWLEGKTAKTWTAKHGHKDANGVGPEEYLKMFI